MSPRVISMRIQKTESTTNHAQAHETHAYARHMPTNSRSIRDLDDAQNEAVREAFRELKRTRWSGNASAAAAELGVSQSTLSRFESGHQGTSMKLAIQVFLLAGKDPRPLVGLPEEPAQTIDRENDPPELAAVLTRPEARAWSPETLGALRGFAAKSSDPMSEFDWWAMGRSIEGHKRIVRVVEDDPVERKKGRKR